MDAALLPPSTSRKTMAMTSDDDDYEHDYEHDYEQDYDDDYE